MHVHIIPIKPKDRRRQLWIIIREIPLEEIADFVQIFNKIKNNYVESLSDREIMERAFHGMATHLDPHSAFLNKEAYALLKENTSGKFGGIGIEIGSFEGSSS